MSHWNESFTRLLLLIVFPLLTAIVTTEYGEIEETISPIALKTISDWTLKLTAGRNAKAHRN